MIATIDIKVNAAHPNIPLSPLYAFEGSPSNVRILNVPQRVGKWQIDAVSVTIALPDNSSTTVSAVAVCGYWVATLPSCDETGYCASGLQITASGVDENGNAVTGYCLGVGDVTILSRDATAVSNGTRYYLHYVAEQPENPNPGDMCYIDGVLKWYNGTLWQGFDNPAALQLTPIYSQTPTFSEWSYSGSLPSGAVVVDMYYDHDPDYLGWTMGVEFDEDFYHAHSDVEGEEATSVSFTFTEGALSGVSAIATRTRTDIIGYTLGDQTTKPLQPQGDYAHANALRYDLVTITTGQLLQDRAVQKVELNAASTTLDLPVLTDLSGKVADFGIDVVNAYTPEVDGTPTPTAASFQLDGTLGTDYNLIVPKGATWSDMTALAPNEMAVYYFTLSAFQIGGKPTWEVGKKVVELVPVPTAP